jgi:hypothetical protein
MSNQLKEYIALLAAAIVFVLSILFIYQRSYKTDDGELIYVIDDPYIHLAISKNIAERGNFGVNRDEFAAASSSPLWSIMLGGGIAIFGDNANLPLYFSFLFAFLSLILFFIILRLNDFTPGGIFAALLLFIYGVPLPAVIFGGMEHSLQILLTLAFVYFAAQKIDATNCRNKLLCRIGDVSLPAMAFLMTAARYECAFVIFIAGLLFIIRQRRLYGLVLWFLGALPVVLFGLYSISSGWHFFPNSVLLKGNVSVTSGAIEVLHSILYIAYSRIAENPHIFAVLAASVYYFIKRINSHRFWEHKTIMLLLVWAPMLLHLQFAGIGWFYRYEAYLIASGILTLCLVINEESARIKEFLFRGKSPAMKLLSLLFIILVIAPFAHRGIESSMRIPNASKNIHDQHYQIAKFLDKYYAKETVALNDIGYVSYHADVDVLDLWGIANLRTLHAKRQGEFDTGKIEKLLEKENVSVAVVYENWFHGHASMPDGWKKAGEWKIRNNTAVAEDEVAFFAKKGIYFDNLVERLREFSAELPADVAQRGFFVASPQ